MNNIVPIDHARAARLVASLEALETRGASVIPLKTEEGFRRAERIVAAIKNALPILGETQTRRICETTLKALSRSQR